MWLIVLHLFLERKTCHFLPRPSLPCPAFFQSSLPQKTQSCSCGPCSRTPRPVRTRRLEHVQSGVVLPRMVYCLRLKSPHDSTESFSFTLAEWLGEFFTEKKKKDLEKAKNVNLLLLPLLMRKLGQTHFLSHFSFIIPVFAPPLGTAESEADWGK